MSVGLICYNIFIASPGGLNQERKSFRKTIEEYSNEEAFHRKVMFRPVGWEDTLGGIGRPQSIINSDLVECDYFVMVLHDRWGSHPGENDMEATSGTEEEYRLALKCLEDASLPMKDVVVLFKAVHPNQLSDPGKELQKVIDFRKQLEVEKTLLYSTFSSVNEFNKQIQKHLSKWLRNGENTSESEEESRIPPISPSTPNDITQDKEGELTEAVMFLEANKHNQPHMGSHSQKETNFRHNQEIDSKENERIARAWKLADEGHIVEAEVEFSKATVDQPGVFQLMNYSRFLRRIGRLEQAMSMVNKALEISRDTNDLVNEASALMEGGRYLRLQGNFSEAEAMTKKSIEIHEKLNDSMRQAIGYENLGHILRIQGKMQEAESVYTKVLNISEQLGDNRGIASSYGNLGMLFRIQGDLPRAEEMFRRTLAISKSAGDTDSEARSYVSLGLVLLHQNKLAEAEKLFRKSLEISEKLNNSEVLASIYEGLGTVLREKNELTEAKNIIEKALEINRKSGRIEGMASSYANLGSIFLAQENVADAENMFKKALEIYEKLGKLEGMAFSYQGLKDVFYFKNDLPGAIEMLNKALEANSRLRNYREILSNYADLAELFVEKGDTQEADNIIHKGLEILKKIEKGN